VWHVEQKSSSPGPKESSPSRRSGWPKGTMMERAIQDLEKGVAECRFCVLPDCMSS
jgi:hypothetical protein